MLNNNGALDFTPDGDLSKKVNHFVSCILKSRHFWYDFERKNFLCYVSV